MALSVMIIPTPGLIGIIPAASEPAVRFIGPTCYSATAIASHLKWSQVIDNRRGF